MSRFSAKFDKGENKKDFVKSILEDESRESPKRPAEKHQGTLSSIHIEPADNGHTVRVSRKVPRKPSKGEPSPGHDYDEKTSVFTDTDEMMSHVRSHLS